MDKPGRKIADHKVYPRIHEKAACLLEAFCREHVFADGDKRIAILAMFTFLTVNNHHIVLPFNTVKYTVKITRCLGQEPDDVEVLIKDINGLKKDHPLVTVLTG